MAIKVETYKEGTVDTQLVRQPEMQRVDMGAGLLPKAIGDTVGAATSIAKTEMRAQEQRENLLMREKMVEAQQGLGMVSENYLALSGGDAYDQLGTYRQNALDTVVGVLDSAKGQLSDQRYKELELVLRGDSTRVMEKFSTHALGGLKQLEEATAKSVSDTGLKMAYSAGAQIIDSDLTDFRAGVDQAVTAKLEHLRLQGLYTDDTSDATKRGVESAASLMFVQAAADTGGYLKAREAYDLLSGSEYALQGEDKSKALGLLDRLKRESEKEDRRAAIADHTNSVLDSSNSWSDIQKRIRDVPLEYQTDVMNTVTSRWNQNHAQQVREAQLHYEEAQRWMAENPGLPLDDFAEVNPEAYQSVANNKVNRARLEQGYERLSDAAFRRRVRSMTDEQLLEEYRAADGDKENPEDENPFLVSLTDNLSKSDSDYMLTRLQKVLDGGRSKSPYVRKIEAQYGQTIQRQITDYWTLATGNRYSSDMSVNKKLKMQAFMNVANAAFDKEFARMEAEGLPPVISNERMLAVLNDTFMVETKDVWYGTDYTRPWETVVPEVMDASANAIRYGFNPEVVVRLSEDYTGSDRALLVKALEQIGDTLSQHPTRTITEDGARRFIKALKEKK